MLNIKQKMPIVVLLSTFFLWGCNGTTTGTGSIWKSSDGGKIWEVKGAVNQTNKIDLTGVDVLSIDINPSNPSNVLVGTRSSGLFKSDDGGTTWENLNFQSEKVYGLAISPADNNIIYASGVWNKRGKLFKSLDAGKTWKEIYTAPSDGPLVISLAIDKKNTDILYATTSDDQVIKTSDGGNTWKNIFQANGPVLQVAIDSEDNSLLYFNVSGTGLFRSKDGGLTIENISKSINDLTINRNGINYILADPSQNKVVYAAGDIGLIKSENGGDSWNSISTLNSAKDFPVNTLAINPTNSAEIIYGAAQASYKSADGGKSWSTSQFTASKSIRVIKYSPSITATIFIGLSK